MSDSNRRDRYALIALVTILLSVVAIVAITNWSNKPPGAEETHKDAGQIEQSNSDDVSRIVAAIREFSPWEDTYAQWIMAAFSVLATGVSLYAVWLIRDTLEANRSATKAAEDGVSIARQSVSLERRAWMKPNPVGRGNIQINPDRIIVDICPSFVNVGVSPATEVRILMIITGISFSDKIKSEEFDGNNRRSPSLFETVFPNETTRISPTVAVEDIVIDNNRYPKVIEVSYVCTYKDGTGNAVRITKCSYAYFTKLSDGENIPATIRVTDANYIELPISRVVT